MAISKIEEKKATLDILENLMDCIDRMRHDRLYYWGRTGEQKQKTKWDGDEKVPVFDDDGEPVMEDVWDDIEKDKEKFTDADRAYLAALDTIQKRLEALI